MLSQSRVMLDLIQLVLADPSTAAQALQLQGLGGGVAAFKCVEMVVHV